MKTIDLALGAPWVGMIRGDDERIVAHPEPEEAP